MQAAAEVRLCASPATVTLMTVAVLACAVLALAVGGCDAGLSMPVAAGASGVSGVPGSANTRGSAATRGGSNTRGSADATGGASGVGPVMSVEPAATTAELRAVRTAMNRFNATAGGSVAAQQSVLSGLISAGQSAAQSRCPPVTVTISMEPVYARLATSPGWRPSSGSLPGTIYAVPTLLRIYTGDRITGTDLTDLHLAIDRGRVTLPAVCLR